MSTRLGVIVGLCVLGVVGIALVAHTIKSAMQVAVVNQASISCAREAKAHPHDRMAMDRCLKARGVLVEDSPPAH